VYRDNVMEIIYRLTPNGGEPSDVAIESNDQLDQVVNKIDSMPEAEEGEFFHQILVDDGSSEYILAECWSEAEDG